LKLLAEAGIFPLGFERGKYSKQASSVETRRKVLSLHDVAVLFDAATTEHFTLWLMLAFGTAARPGAILQLKTDQIDLQHRLIDFNPVAVELRKRGVSMAEVAGLLGHKMERFATTEIYARYSPDYQSAAVRALDDFFRELSPLLARPLLGFQLEDQPTPADLRAQALSAGAASRLPFRADR
jgi:hypothetical protein